MQAHETKGLEEWVAFLSQADIPVLKQTERDLNVLHEDVENINARDVASVIARDPMMTVKLLRYLQSHKRNKQEHEVVQIEQALLMLGIGSFFNNLPARPLVEELLAGHTTSLINLLQVVRRSHRASHFALDWAVSMRDMHFEEVRIAALLYDLAELLMWSFAPVEMLKISAMQQHNKSMRSRSAQEEVLGFSIVDLQMALVREWSLPRLLLTLMDNESAKQPRSCNVIFAVNLARHSAKGWEDAALPDDYKDIGKLLNIKMEDVIVMLGVEAGNVCDLNKPR